MKTIHAVLLDALAACTGPANTEMVTEFADPRGERHLKPEQVGYSLAEMVADGYVYRIGNDDGSGAWAITQKGRAHLVAIEAKQIFADCERHTPVRRPRIEEAPESYSPGPESLNERLRACHEELDRQGVPRVSVCNAKEPKLPAFARVAINEDELDDWWSSLDVTAKGVAFTEYSLQNAGPTIAADPARIPVTGTVGDLSPEMIASFCTQLRGVGKIPTVPLSQAQPEPLKPSARDPFQVGGAK